jgi:hypothetical protein
MSIVLMIAALLLVPSLANASVAHTRSVNHRCKRGYHRVHHGRRHVCVRTRRHRRPTSQPISTPAPAPGTGTGTAPPPPSMPTLPGGLPAPPLPQSRTSNMSMSGTSGDKRSALQPDALGADPGITFGGGFCGVDQTGVGFPFVTSPSGTWDFVANVLYARPDNGSSGWEQAAPMDWWYNGTARPPIFDWFHYPSNQASGGTGDMTTWNINPGWQVAIVQYVVDDGNIYDNLATDCMF